jgi:hypothetical protein
MPIVIDILLMLHFVSMAAGFVSMFGNIAIAPMASNPNAVGALRGVRAGFLRVGSYGIAGLWITGLLLLWLRYGFQAPWQFWVKLLAVLILSGIVGYVNMLAGKARGGGRANRQDRPVRRHLRACGRHLRGVGVPLGRAHVFTAVLPERAACA